MLSDTARVYRRHPVPAEVYALVERAPATVLLEGGKPNSSETDEKPWTQLFVHPVRVCVANSAIEFSRLFGEIDAAIAGGQVAAGFFSYECGACFEPKAKLPPSREGQPLAWFGIYDRSFVFDHSTGEFVGGKPGELVEIRAEAGGEKPAVPPAPPSEVIAEFALTEPEYTQRIAAIHEWIRAGDVYQLNFTAPFSVKAEGSAASHYARLRGRQPVDYGAFIHWQQGQYILSFSPELFFRIDRDGDTRRIVTRPMNGTAPRGRTTREDRAIADWLRNDPKNRSENVMIVDLLRNDLGRVARFGTVHTDNLFSVERYSTLWQMTSTVTAELRPEAGFQEIFRALFPCGSVTGAPKVRAMQLLAELEGAPRGIYTGAIGFFSRERTVFNVAIRTLELAGGRGIFGAGSGVVIDSDPAEEFRECLLKAKFLTCPTHQDQEKVSQPDKFFLIETMLWNGTFPLLELHLDRLTDSADYFGFACDRTAVCAALEQHVRQFSDKSPRKVRLLLTDLDGNFGINSEPLALDADPDRIGRVSIAKRRTDPADPSLYHKTTQRGAYILDQLEAQRNGFDDVLFLNLRGQVTEGAISNVFIERDGRWFTPPIECGLLAGVYRRHVLEARSETEERVLTLDDLRDADAVYITNAVRGPRRVEIEAEVE
jgi:para-aminobenzoate synthetase/4-amino-4-deoxychorismate lyase